ncbi:bifunctional apoptosis regulator-like [Pecten maximus]|uniref:bifunctional apoptosis regulator-like n=1 Tax=Pecten maximus TaxID=6579 RepID=UPI001457E81D|nr:bifunctional apoptosis regulator-like [Pecten maximus]XP_033755450.1 bifunctional apoptosis regulator-like [Pecten maximus]
MPVMNYSSNSHRIQMPMMSTEDHGEAECGCCFELLVEPTTLVCGHTFCRHCLAKWTVTSGRRLCPTCKSEWRGSPKVNIMIRNMLENAFSQKLAARTQEVDTEENRRLIKRFDAMANDLVRQEIMNLLQNSVQAGRAAPRHNDTRCKYFSSGIAIGVLVVCILAYIWNIGQKELINTPVKEWNNDDVVTWMGQLGTWTDRYSDSIRNNGIDGKMLLMMEERDAIEALHMTDELQRRVFLREVAALATTGTKQPVNFWEYKSTFPFYTLFMLFGIKLFPRITIGYIYLFEYETVYAPFMKYAYPELLETGMTDATTFSRVFYIVFLPYYLIGRYALTWSSVHYYISRYILLICVLATIHDIMWISSIILKKLTKKDIQDHVYLFLNLLMILVLSSVLPWFLFNFFFYDNALSSIITYPSAIYTLWKRIKWIQ